MENILFITDYIEGHSFIASVRYEELMEYFINDFNVYVIHNANINSEKSRFSKKEITYLTWESKYTQDVGKNIKDNVFSKVLRNKYILKIWRSYKYSKFAFTFKNKDIYKKIDELVASENITKVFITIPYLYGIYIGNYIKKNYDGIEIIYEVRDIINHNLGEGNPRLIYKNAEKLLVNSATKIIALSMGILEHYQSMIKNYNVRLIEIKNGYNEKLFLKNEVHLNEDSLILTHIGTLYKGRNIKDFIYALNRFAKEQNRKVILNLVGYMDIEAKNEVCEVQEGTSNFEINLIGAVNHEVAIDYLIKSDIAVILTHKKGSDYAIPGKTYEYIGAQKPILAVTEDKYLIDLIDNKYGECSRHNIEDIYEKLKLITRTEYKFDDREQYSRKSQYNKIKQFIR